MKTFFSPYTGDADDDLFVSWTSSEHYEMERALGGEEVNSGVKLSPKLVWEMYSQSLDTDISQEGLVIVSSQILYS